MARTYRFDDIQLDLRNFRVVKTGRALLLEPKSLNVLVFLIEQRGRLVEKQELLDAVWGDAHVTENVLTRAIAQLRKVLGDDAREARYIETVPTRGYRFIAQVEVEENGNAAVARPASTTPVSQPVPAPGSRHVSRRYAIAAAAVLAGVVLAAGIILFRGREAPKHLQIRRETLLTTTDALTRYPTFSPDSTAMAYSADRGKGFEIFVRQLSTEGQEIQITSDGGNNMEPAWSPDGKLIAYSSQAHHGIWLVPALGGTSRKLSDFGSHPAWSRDGQWIAFQSGQTISSWPSTIWVMRPDGSGARQVTPPGKPEGGLLFPSWSPDGRHIVFISAQTNHWELWAVGADGARLVRLGPDANPYYDPVYSPDGKSIVYGATFKGEDHGVWQLPVSPETSAPIEEPVELVNSGGMIFSDFSFSRDGKKLLYYAWQRTSSIRSASISANGEGAAQDRLLTGAAGCRVTLPAFSPDGTRIAFTGCIGRPGVQSQIFQMNSDGSNVQQVTANANGGGGPAWSPDGRRMFFQSNANGKPALFSVEAATRQQREIAEFERDAGQMQLSPDGTRVAYNRSIGGVINIWLLDLATQKSRQLTFDKEFLGFPSWSPDGKLLTGELHRGADTNIVILPSTGGVPTQLTFDHGNNWPHSWSPDGDKILFARQQDDGIWNVWSVSRSTKQEKQLTHYNRQSSYVRYPTLSPRGNQVVYEYAEAAGNIWMMEFK